MTKEENRAYVKKWTQEHKTVLEKYRLKMLLCTTDEERETVKAERHAEILAMSREKKKQKARERLNAEFI